MKTQESMEKKYPKHKGYLRAFRRYFKYSFLWIVLMLIIIGATVYLIEFHEPAIATWYKLQGIPTIRISSPYLHLYSGKARLVSSNNTIIYEGQINQAVVEGEGLLYQDGNLLYSGMFSQNMYSGAGELYGKNGELLYSGSFSENLYNGDGVLYDGDGNKKYEGQFEKGAFSGFGTLYYIYNDEPYRYIGNFEKGMRDGEGRVLNGDALVYIGGFKRNQYHGEGRLYIKGEIVYEGGFVDGEFEGFGITQDDKWRYEGEFRAGKYEGTGKLYENSGLVYEGEFLGGKFHGTGIEYNPNTGFRRFAGSYFEGERMIAGILYDDKGREIKELPQLLDVSKLLNESYEKVCRALIEVGITYRIIPPQDDVMLLVDDYWGTVYEFTVNKETEEPLVLSAFYLCGLSGIDGVVVGMDIHKVSLKKAQIKINPLVGEQFALALSNEHWKNNFTLSDLAEQAFTSKEYMITAYYVRNQEIEEKEINDQVIEKETEEANVEEMIVFLKVHQKKPEEKK